MEDMQVQGRGGVWSVALVVWTDCEGGSRPLSPPASLIGHFQHLLVAPGFRGEFCCEATSTFLLGQGLVLGERTALPSLAPSPDTGRPWSRAVCKTPCRTGLQQGMGQVLGKLQK